MNIIIVRVSWFILLINKHWSTYWHPRDKYPMSNKNDIICRRLSRPLWRSEYLQGDKNLSIYRKKMFNFKHIIEAYHTTTDKHVNVICGSFVYIFIL